MLDFDPSKIDFDVEMNELSMRYVSIKKAIDVIGEDETFNSEDKIEILLNLQKELSHIKSIYKLISLGIKA